jgi:hypothetical protein
MNASCSLTMFTGGTGIGATATKQPETALFTHIRLAF